MPSPRTSRRGGRDRADGSGSSLRRGREGKELFEIGAVSGEAVGKIGAEKADEALVSLRESIDDFRFVPFEHLHVGPREPTVKGDPLAWRRAPTTRVPRVPGPDDDRAAWRLDCDRLVSSLARARVAVAMMRAGHDMRRPVLGVEVVA